METGCAIGVGGRLNWVEHCVRRVNVAEVFVGVPDHRGIMKKQWKSFKDVVL